MEEQKGIGVDLSIASKEMIEALISESESRLYLRRY